MQPWGAAVDSAGSDDRISGAEFPAPRASPGCQLPGTWPICADCVDPAARIGSSGSSGCSACTECSWQTGPKTGPTTAHAAGAVVSSRGAGKEATAMTTRKASIRFQPARRRTWAISSLAALGCVAAAAQAAAADPTATARTLQAGPVHTSVAIEAPNRSDRLPLTDVRLAEPAPRAPQAEPRRPTTRSATRRTTRPRPGKCRRGASFGPRTWSADRPWPPGRRQSCRWCKPRPGSTCRRPRK